MIDLRPEPQRRRCAPPIGLCVWCLCPLPVFVDDAICVGGEPRFCSWDCAVALANRVRAVLPPATDRKAWPFITPGWHSETEPCDGRCGTGLVHRWWLRLCARCGHETRVPSPMLGPHLCGSCWEGQCGHRHDIAI